VTEVVASLARAWGEGASWHVADGNHPHEAGFLAVDSALARARLGWRPRQSLAAASEWTGRWYRRHAAGQNAAVLINADIQEYMNLEVSP
jgi:CDP-glucose 4,6-dehydratase